MSLLSVVLLFTSENLSNVIWVIGAKNPPDGLAHPNDAASAQNARVRADDKNPLFPLLLSELMTSSH